MSDVDVGMADIEASGILAEQGEVDHVNTHRENEMTRLGAEHGTPAAVLFHVGVMVQLSFLAGRHLNGNEGDQAAIDAFAGALSSLSGLMEAEGMIEPEGLSASQEAIVRVSNELRRAFGNRDRVELVRKDVQ